MESPMLNAPAATITKRKKVDQVSNTGCSCADHIIEGKETKLDANIHNVFEKDNHEGQAM